MIHSKDMQVQNFMHGTVTSTLLFESTCSSFSDTSIAAAKADAAATAFISQMINNSAGSSNEIDVFLTSTTSGNISVDDVVTDIQTALSAADATTTFSDQVTVSNASGKVRFVNNKGYDVQLRAGTTGNGFALADINLHSNTL